MIVNLPPYPEYKGLALPWLSRIPRHWSIKRGKSIFHCVDMRSLTGREELLTVSSARGVVPRNTATVTMFKATSYIGYKLCWPGDLVINSLWAWACGLGVSKYHGIVSSAYGVYRVYDHDSVRPAFIHEFVRSSAFNWELRVRSKGIWTSRLQLTDESFLDAPVLLPPPDEQDAIVRFLDHANRRIERYIRAKKKLIALLNEQKQAIIHRAVTRGLDPNIRLKPSGVEWLGDVPKHWEVLPIKRAFVSIDYGISESATDTGTVRLLTMGNIKDGETTIPEAGGVARVDDSLLLAVGDLLFNRTNSSELVGKVGIFRGSTSAVTFASYLVRMRPRGEHDPEYLNMVLNDNSILLIARREAIPSLHQSNLNPTRYGRLHISLPPLKEQREIHKFVKESTCNLDRTIAAGHREIALLREYQTRLVADVVTGQVDVREAAAKLPEEPREEDIEPVEGLADDEAEPSEFEDMAGSGTIA